MANWSEGEFSGKTGFGWYSFRLYHLGNARGLWTWPPRVICSPAFNHKIGNAAHSGVSEVLLFTKSYKWKKQRWTKWTSGRLLLETMRFWWSPTVRQFKMAARRMWAQKKLTLLRVAWQWSNYSLLFPCSISKENFHFSVKHFQGP